MGRRQGWVIEMRQQRRLRSPHLFAFVAVAAVLALAAALSEIPGTDAAVRRLAGEMPDHVTIRLRAAGASGVSGKATLRSVDGVTTVAVRIDGRDVAYPAHVHEGTCGEFEAMPGFPLADAEPDRISRTVVDVSLAHLLAGNYVINLHRPAMDLATLLDPASVVACGAIVVERSASGPAVTTPPDTGVGAAFAASTFGGLSIAMTAAAIVLAGVGITLRQSERRMFPRYAA
jgi:hypothetical protein